MKINDDTLLIGAFVLAGGALIIAYLLLMGNGPQSNSPLGEIINKFGYGNKMSPEQEEEKAAMYGYTGGYY